ncbi:dynamin family protein [Caballeronia novacaledonica]|uniref:dynamin family protein n=1 Tax=Caballeronia novacaledonica TaxID=1544861 RepID=UPI001EE196AA|nr:dynamin family protein [Caballeronia novacaledonica]GJH14281.1 dynamin family protein [Caballeronia novacaledonica]
MKREPLTAEQEVIELSDRINAWLDQFDELIGRDARPYAREFAIDRTSELSGALGLLNDEARLLQIGVVGRVKAGKSSLLNALIFDGRPILPKAATPMTAALTTLAYDEEFRAEVQFYSPDDIEHMRENSFRYEQYLEAEQERAAQTLRQRPRPGGGAVPTEDHTFRSEVDKLASRNTAARHAMLHAAHDQYRRISDAGLDRLQSGKYGKIKARDAADLAKKLLDYVGADGQYMPVTKSVDIYLPLDSLRDVRIIDTPGMNDPVVSREARTTELLKNCDVVFIVSPAGQFLTDHDLDMMGRIVQREGVQELVMVASQVDNQLFGSEVRRPTIEGALGHITQTLGRHMVGTLQRLKQSNPEIGRLFDGLIDEHGAGKIVYTSGICHGMSARFDAKRSWDSGEKKVWENLTRMYPDSFPADDFERCRAKLDVLGNISALSKVLARVRQQKNEIIEGRRRELVLAKSKSIAEFVRKTLDLIDQRTREVRAASVEDLKKQQRKLKGQIDVTRHELDGVYKEELRAYRRELLASLTRILKDAYQSTDKTVAASREVDRETRTRDSDGFVSWVARGLWGGGTEEYTVNVTRVHTQQVINGLRKFARDLHLHLSHEAAAHAEKFAQQLIRRMAKAATDALKDDVEPHIIIRSVNGVVNAIELPGFELDDGEVRTFKASGVLRDGEAISFFESARGVMENLHNDADGQISSFIEHLFGKQLRKSIADEFFGEVNQRIDQLQSEVEHAEQTLGGLASARRALESH